MADRPLLQLRDAAVELGGRRIWAGLSLDIHPGQFWAVLGPNGAGKTTFLRVLLGLQPLSGGTVHIGGRPLHRGSPEIGYIPQQRAFDRDLPIRGRDLIRLGADGHRFGWHRGGRELRRRVDQVIADVGAEAIADAPIGTLSGGEQQRLRVAEALLSDPRVLLCDEPLLSLDIAQQRTVTELIDRTRKRRTMAVVFVTHEINPVLPYVDSVLYLAHGRFASGGVDQVLTTETLTSLYGTPVEVTRRHGRVMVAAADDAALTEPGGHVHGDHVVSS